MRFWLTGDSHPVHMSETELKPHTVRIETFSPPSDE
jgi:hypothetical protein